MSLKIPPVIIVLTALLLMWLVDASVPGGLFEFVPQKKIAAGLLVIAIVILLAGVLSFRRAATTVNPTAPERTSAIVTNGVFRYSRNPMYLSMLILLTAGFLVFGHGINVIVLIAFVAYMTRWQIIPEEQALERKFGDAYRIYKSRVRRWL